MTERTDFISQAFYTLARAIAEAGVNVDLFKHPETIPVSVHRRVRAELRRLGVLLRRLIFLMALQMELPPVKPRAGRNYFEKSEGPAETRYSFSLVPTKAGEVPSFLRGPQIVPDRGPVPAAPLIARWEAMLATLKFCRRRARCLARTIQRWQAEGEPRPHVPPTIDSRSLPAALGLVSGGLTLQLMKALERWPDPDTG